MFLELERITKPVLIWKLEMSVAGVNGLGLSHNCTSNKIMKQDFKWYPYQIVTRHELCNPDYVRRYQFYEWFLNQYRDRRFLAKIIDGDEASFNSRKCPSVMLLLVSQLISPRCEFKTSQATKFEIFQ